MLFQYYNSCGYWDFADCDKCLIACNTYLPILFLTTIFIAYHELRYILVRVAYLSNDNL